MNIQRNAVVTIDYDLTDKNGNLIDSSKNHGPLSFIHGLGHIIPGLETALEGMTMGQETKAVISADKAYGEHRKELVQTVSRQQFEQGQNIEVGMQFEANTENGPMVFQVVEVSPETVTVDGNHPLAGVELHFQVKIVNIRQATQDELVHGHVHGPGGHHH